MGLLFVAPRQARQEVAGKMARRIGVGSTGRGRSHVRHRTAEAQRLSRIGRTGSALQSGVRNKRQSHRPHGAVLSPELDVLRQHSAG